MGVIFKNNVMYGAGDIEISPVCYSEEEREIGCWVDGKPLYQKTWTGLTITPQYNIWTNLFQVTDIDKIIDWGARDTGTCCLNGTGLEITYNSSSSNYIKAEYTQNSNVRQIGTLTLQYTKTTDTPGSGIWTPSGVPAVHYSENEQVVGTWVDGKTIYEKTFIQDLTNTAMNTLLDVADVSSLNIDKICSIVGHAYVNNASMTRWLSQGANLIYQYNVATKKINVVQTQAAGLNLTAYVTVEYTKTTS